MIQCTACDRHHAADEGACPFCGAETARPGPAARRPLSGRLLRTAGAGLTAVVLAACYGPPAGGWDDTGLGGGEDDSGVVDLDDDGFGEDIDCDDTDATINPGATEICDDGVDNDCDEQIDLADDDCEEG